MNLCYSEIVQGDRLTASPFEVFYQFSSNGKTLRRDPVTNSVSGFPEQKLAEGVAGFFFIPQSGMAKRKTLSKKIRFEVFKRDSFTCQYCGRSAPDVILHADHIQPVSKDGEDDILNLVTSCFDCNSGKSDRELSDASVIHKQKAQLDELNERREQLEMMIGWREGLHELKDLEIEAACDEWRRVTETYYLNDHGIANLKKLVRKFGLTNVLDAMQKSAKYLQPDADGKYTAESVDLAFKKVGGICQIGSLPEWKQQIYHIRNIARNRMYWGCSASSAAYLLELFEKAYHLGADVDKLRALAGEGLNFTPLCAELEAFIKERSGK